MRINHTIYTALKHMTSDDVYKFVKAYKDKEVGCLELENIVLAWNYSGRKTSMTVYTKPSYNSNKKLSIARLIKFLKETWKMSDMEIMKILDHMLFD